jgi:hypothetical protein
MIVTIQPPRKCPGAETSGFGGFEDIFMPVDAARVDDRRKLDYGSLQEQAEGEAARN